MKSKKKKKEKERTIQTAWTRDPRWRCLWVSVTWIISLIISAN